eukprot:2283524-Rhodomonas_salina.1
MSTIRELAIQKALRRRFVPNPAKRRAAGCTTVPRQGPAPATFADTGPRKLRSAIGVFPHGRRLTFSGWHSRPSSFSR